MSSGTVLSGILRCRREPSPPTPKNIPKVGYMKFFVTGVNGQLGHDVVNEAVKRGYDVTGSDITEQYNGLADGSAVCSADYVKLDITDREAVSDVIA